MNKTVKRITVNLTEYEYTRFKNFYLKCLEESEVFVTPSALVKKILEERIEDVYDQWVG